MSGWGDSERIEMRSRPLEPASAAHMQPEMAEAGDDLLVQRQTDPRRGVTSWRGKGLS